LIGAALGTATLDEGRDLLAVAAVFLGKVIARNTVRHDIEIRRVALNAKGKCLRPRSA